MAFFKKPFVAICLSFLIVVLATFVTTNVKLGSECKDVTDGFYTGKLYSGQKEESIYSQLHTLLGLADDLELIASNYDVNTEALCDARDDMQYGIIYSHDDVSYLYYTYDELLTALKGLYNELLSSDLSPRDAASAEDIMSGVATAQDVIRSSGYNESVREYLLQYERFPTEIMGDFANVNKPQYFS